MRFFKPTTHTFQKLCQHAKWTCKPIFKDLSATFTTYIFTIRTKIYDIII